MATTNIKQDWQKIWQPTVGEVLVVLKAANKQEFPPPPPSTTNQRIVCIEQMVARPYVLCNLALAPLIQFTIIFSGERYALLWSCFDHDHAH